jgi:hypothetical protein
VAGPGARQVAGPTGKEARDVYKLDEHYSTPEETLAKIGFPPGRKRGQLGFTFHA